MLIGIVRVLGLPPQCTWRFLMSLHLESARQLGKVQAGMRQHVWDAANLRLTEVTLDTDTTVHKQIARRLHEVIAALGSGVQTVPARADSGFYCWEAVAAENSAAATSFCRPAKPHAWWTS